MDLKTTTLPARHTELFRQARSLLAAGHGKAPLHVLEAGPGLAVKYLGRLSARSVPANDIFKRIETGVRRVPWPDAFYESYEPGDLLRALDGLPVRLTVLDVNPRVLRVISRLPLQQPVKTVRADLSQAEPESLKPLYGTFDLVVAMAVIGRVKWHGRDNARTNLRRLARLGGIILGEVDSPARDHAVIPGHPLFYRKTSE